MKALFLLISLAAGLQTTMAQSSLPQRLDSIIGASPLSHTAQVAVMVWDLQADSCLYTHNETKVMRPASTMKLLTALTALSTMGENAVVRADSMGGQLRADFSMKDTIPLGEGWCWDDDNPLLNRRDTAIATHTLLWLLQPMLKASNNLAAEAVFYNCGGQRAVERYVRRLADETAWLKLSTHDMPSYRVADGSGLSLYNYVTTQLLVAALRHAWRHPELLTPLTRCLPVAGVDGTLQQRMQHTKACGHVLAKTGTLTGVSALAGYYLPHPIAFAIIVNGTLRQQPARHLQDLICAEF